RRHHAVLADGHRGVGRALVLGIRAGHRRGAGGGRRPSPVAVPVAFTTSPGELRAAPRSWVESVHPGLAYFNEVDRGGHFPAWEEPELFSDELRAAFRPLR